MLLLQLIFSANAVIATTETRHWLPLNYTAIAANAAAETRDCCCYGCFFFANAVIAATETRDWLPLNFTAIAVNAAARTRDCCYSAATENSPLAPAELYRHCH